MATQPITGNAARLRCRAVLMPAFSFVLGILPLVVATGQSGKRDRGRSNDAVCSAGPTHICGGMLLGVGLCFIAIPALRPWSTSIPTAIFCFMAGALAARLLGLLVDGTVPKQWLLVAVEAVAMAVAALWLWRNSGSAP